MGHGAEHSAVVRGRRDNPVVRFPCGVSRMFRRRVRLRRPSSLSPAIPHNWVYPSPRYSASCPSNSAAVYYCDTLIPRLYPRSINFIHYPGLRCTLVSHTSSSPHTNHSPRFPGALDAPHVHTSPRTPLYTPETAHPLLAPATTVRREAWIHPSRGLTDVASAWAMGLGTWRLFKEAALLLFCSDLGLVFPSLDYPLYTQATLIPICSYCVVT